MEIFIYIILGLLIGYCYFICFEKKKINNKFHMECWAKLHYLGKEKSSLFMVHLKSIMVGIFIIWCASTGCNKNYKKIITIFGAAIIGLHIGQYYNEMRYIKLGR